MGRFAGKSYAPLDASLVVPTAMAQQCQECGFKHAIRIPGQIDKHPDVIAIENQFQDVVKFGDQHELCGDCYFNHLYLLRNPTDVSYDASVGEGVKEIHEVLTDDQGLGKGTPVLPVADSLGTEIDDSQFSQTKVVESNALVSIRSRSTPNFERFVDPNGGGPVSTNDRPSLVLMRSPAVSTNETLQNVLQQELIRTDASQWKRLGGKYKPPIPDRHVLNPSGKKQFGRKTLTGFEILRKVRCTCGGESRLTAGYISATQLFDMGDDDYETQVGIVRQILRKRARGIDARINGVRCSSCRARSEAQNKDFA